MTQLIEVTLEEIKNAPLYHSPMNQIRRAIGKFSTIHLDNNSLTVLDNYNHYFDVYLDGPKIEGTPFNKVKIYPSR